MRKLFVAVILFGAGVATGIGVSRWQATRDSNVLTLGRDLATISLCANGLNSLADEGSKTARLLDQQLRSAIENASTISDAAADFEIETPNLKDGLRRAKAYAERVGDQELSARIDRLQASILQPAR